MILGFPGQNTRTLSPRPGGRNQTRTQHKETKDTKADTKTSRKKELDAKVPGRQDTSGIEFHHEFHEVHEAEKNTRRREDAKESRLEISVCHEQVRMNETIDVRLCVLRALLGESRARKRGLACVCLNPAGTPTSRPASRAWRPGGGKSPCFPGPCSSGAGGAAAAD